MSFDIELARRFLGDERIEVTDGRKRVSVLSGLSTVRLQSFGHFHLPENCEEAQRCLAISGLIAEYAKRQSVERPLSLAVFGPPGSGKSFAVKQIVSHANGYKKPVTINLSQVADEMELGTALDEAFGGRAVGGIPTIFFDEFDSEQLRWLKWFLAPMQDGEYVVGGRVKKTGPALFVFAGGTVERLAEFEPRYVDIFVTSKGPDFVSRLRGVLDISGINSDCDRVFRRTLVLHHLLGERSKSLVKKNDTREVDNELLPPLLQHAYYTHGTRSLEALLDMWQLSGKNAVTEKDLPDLALRRMHISYGPLDGSTIGVAAGNETNATDFFEGFAENVVTRGADLAYGGDLTDEGTLNAMIKAASTIRLAPLLPDRVRITNYLCFPNYHKTEFKKLRERYKDLDNKVIQFVPLEPTKRELDLLDLTDDKEWFQNKPAARHAMWAISLFRMRLTMIQEIDALVAVGGKNDNSSWGRFSGIAEEVMLATALNKPVYLLGMAGGGAAAVGTLVGLSKPKGQGLPLGECLTIDTSNPDEKKKVQEKLDVIAECFDVPYLASYDLPTDVAGLREFLVKRLPRSTEAWMNQNGLSLEENRELFNRRSDEDGIDKSIELIVRGLQNVRTSVR